MTPSPFDSLPPPHKFQSCPKVASCTGATATPENLKKVDELLSRVWKCSTPCLFVNELLNYLRSGLKTAAAEFFIKSVVEEPNGVRSTNARRSFVAVFKSKMEESRTVGADERLMRGILTEFGKQVATPMFTSASKLAVMNHPTACGCTISEQLPKFEFLDLEYNLICRTNGPLMAISMTITDMLNMNPIASYAKTQLLEPILNPLTLELWRVGREYLESNPESRISIFFQLMKRLGGIRTVNYSNLESSLTLSNLCLPIVPLIDLLVSKKWKEEGGVELLEKMKIEADREAAAKNYSKAIQVYSIISTLIPNMNALVNCAALRLRVAEDTDVFQFSMVIFDCTFALELEPNHVKALFRRGLAFCKLKMWNEGIVDFQQAVELDPRSPAKQELAYALRQVGKRIGA